jgi:hypothetical protein
MLNRCVICYRFQPFQLRRWGIRRCELGGCMRRDADFPCPPAPLSLAFAYFFAQAAESLCEPFHPVSDPAAYDARNHATFGTLAGLHFVLGSGFVVCGLWTLVWCLVFEVCGLWIWVCIRESHCSHSTTLNMRPQPP